MPTGICNYAATTVVTAAGRGQRVRGTNFDGVRRGNLAAILELVHRRGAASRAELTRLTGLNRSTIGALVGELDELGLVLEAGPDVTTTVGRPSPIVRPDPSFTVIAVNPELDAVTVGLVGLGGVVRRRIRRAVDHALAPEEAVALIAELAIELEEGDDEAVVFAIGVAVPGVVRASDGMVRWAPHLHWRDQPVAAMLADATGHRVSVGNDASLGAVAEQVFGAGRGVDDLVYLNGGASGIGGGVIAGGAPLSGVSGYAGEFGQNRPGFDRHARGITLNGTLEDEVSRSRLLDVVGLRDADEAELEQALLSSEDPAVREEIGRQQEVLAAALGNAANVLNPRRVILGGFLAALYAADPEALARWVAAGTVAAAFDDLEIVRAALGPDLLMIGAAELAFEAIIADPSLVRASVPREL
jgi:predicted NBD/HSP70 family sugar kinase